MNVLVEAKVAAAREIIAPGPRAVPPVDVPALAIDDAGRRRLDALCWTFVGVGIALRLARYLLNFPLWGDELMLAQNFLDRGYLELARPLSMQQIAPVPFLWIELTAVKAFGFSEWSLRLWAILCGLASVVLFRDLAARVLGKAPMVLAVGIFAVSYYPIRHAAECKPYASDLAASLMLLVLFVRWCQDPTKRRWLGALAVAGPLAVALSYPTIFVAGGIGLALAWRVWETRDRRAWPAVMLYGALVGGAFLLSIGLAAGAQYAASRDFMVSYWAGGFPPWKPIEFLVWLISKHAGEMMAYPVGDENFGSSLTLLLFVIGAVALMRRRQWSLALVVLAPLALAFVAAAMHRYPYGGARLAQYYAPLACLTAGLGGACLIGSMGHVWARRPAFVSAVAILLVLGGCLLARDMAHPYKRLVDYEHRGFARWLWDPGVTGRAVSLRTDLGLDLYPGTPMENYRCYERIFSPRRAECPLDARLVRCVAYCDEGAQRDEAAFATWMAQMTRSHELTNQDTYRVKLNGPREPLRIGLYQVYEFQPKRLDAGVGATAERQTGDAAQR
ncbi:MAG: glycosyltransferase family 39 protein [Planctomycetia bacterium]|nr:glycosyltransferase family 39 protein [Planctomycetia bacterium]